MMLIMCYSDCCQTSVVNWHSLRKRQAPNTTNFALNDCNFITRKTLLDSYYRYLSQLLSFILN